MPDFCPATSARLPFGERHQNRRRREVEVGRVDIGAVGLVGQAARGVPRVAGRHLPRPENLARVEIHRDERVAHFDGRRAVVVAGRGVQRVAPDVDRRAAPDAGARRSPQLRADRVLLRRLRLFGDRVGLPDLPAVGRVERDDAAAESAALVAGRRAGRFFARRHRHVEPPVVKHDRADDARERMRVGLHRPDQRAGRGVDARRRCRSDRRRTRRTRGPCPSSTSADRDRSAHAAFRFEEPVDAAGRRAQRVDLAAPAADEDAAADDRGLRVGVEVAGEPERPFHFQAWHLPRPSGRRRPLLEARVGRVLAPAVPARPVQRIREVGVSSRTSPTPEASSSDRAPRAICR